MRHGVPYVNNILEVLPDKLKRDIFGDADSLMSWLEKGETVC